MSCLNYDPKTDEVKFVISRKYDSDKTKNEDQMIMKVIDYFLNTFDYLDISGQLLKAFNYWIQAPEDKLEKHHRQFRLETVGLLLTQDICEDRQQRQGKPTAQLVYGTPFTLSACVYSVFIPKKESGYFHTASELCCTQLVKHSRIRNLLYELSDRVVCPSEELYYELCGYRGTMMELIEELQSLQVFYENNNPAFVKLANNIRTFLTIVDECRRVAVGNTDDIAAGYFSLPMLYTIKKNADEGKVVLHIIRHRKEDPLLMAHAISVIKNTDCLEYAKKKLGLLKEEIFKEYKQLDTNPLMNDFFNEYLQIPDNFEDIHWELS